MDNRCFEKCIVMGTGQLAFNCARYLKEICQLDNVFEFGSYVQSGLKNLCRKNDMPYKKLSTKLECDEVMKEIVNSGVETLIISASNIYIFPKAVIQNKNILAINYHPALLSKHLGRNAEAWAIYDRDKTTGVTWHEVTTKVDQGAILAEDTIMLDDDITALKLMIKQYQAGYRLFKEFIGKVLQKKDINKRVVSSYGKMHYSYEKPNNGILQLEWDGQKISAFLRSMDYGALQVMGLPCIIEENKKYYWDSYRIFTDYAETGLLDSKIIRKDDYVFVLYHYHEVMTV